MSRSARRLGAGRFWALARRPRVTGQALAGVALVIARDGVAGAGIALLVSGRALVRIRRAG